MLSYKYYDTPDGEDVIKKVFVTSKYAAITGLGAGAFDVLMFSHPQGFLNTAGRLMWYVGPLVGMASAFTVTANVAQSIRGKNDKINYFLGGVVAGSVYGAWQKSVAVGVPAGIILGIAAIVKKSGVDEGWTFFPDINQATKTIKSVKHDWTLVKDIEELKNFSTGSK